MKSEALKLLLTRRSVVANKMAPPGPTPRELEIILRAAARVPDHKKLVPWRFIIFDGPARSIFGKILASICEREETEPPSAMRLEMEAKRFLRAPVVIAVISVIKDKPGVPEWEQILSAGAVCQNLLIAANASGYVAQWITEWYAFNENVRAALRLDDHERVAGFIYIGTAQETPSERDRPNLSNIVWRWRPPRS